MEVGGNLHFFLILPLEIIDFFRFMLYNNINKFSRKKFPMKWFLSLNIKEICLWSH